MSVSFTEVANKYCALSSTLSNRTTYIPSECGYNNVEYVWIDDISSAKLLSKTQRLGPGLLSGNISIGEIPKTTFNTNTERTNGCCKNTGLLQPVHFKSNLNFESNVYSDPLRSETNRERNILTLCETFLSNDKPTTSTKNRIACKSLMEYNDVPRFYGEFEIEQEFSFREIPAITCTAHKDRVRKTLESFNRACNYAGLTTNGFSIENHPKSFLSYKIGPCGGLRVSDELWMSRYILQRVAEEFHLTPHFGPITDDYQVRCPRALYSFSTYEMRDRQGINEAKKCIEKMRERHMQDLKYYDSTCAVTEADLWKRDVVGEFSEVVTIPLLTQKNGKGCIVDYRPRGNSDPYVVTRTIVASACL